ncbi:Glutaminase 2 [Candidatus Promineifilum breve]|uniref:Glutaminase n=1 Tax=Candidatus Promineifilum breve TaxID=1806508 RepID=A0A160T746_9CHLR|nr:glutaminase A [Candidatus Promineifilum breve]CUS05128.2 Glutaminase 2 [Candidatus Promineifilum breve]
MVEPIEGEVGSTFISTGHLPSSGMVQALVDQARERFKDNDEGQNASHYPALALVPRDLFGICLTGSDGQVFTAGDVDVDFTIMSIAKPFTLALIYQVLGAEIVRQKVGLNATGLPFNSVQAIELHPDRKTNPMVNPGALATVSLVPGRTAEDKWSFIREGLSRFAGRELTLNEQIYASASASNSRNRGISRILYDYKRLYFDPEETTDVYTRQSSLNVTARDLAVMAATLADGGVNPLTGERVIEASHCRHVLAVMVISGMYNSSGEWLFDVGLPAKSGVGGGIITVAPGKGGMATFAPPLDPSGNSIRGKLATMFLSERLGLNMLASASA